MKRALVRVALVLGCHFSAVMVTGLSYLMFGPPDHFSRVTEDSVYWQRSARCCASLVIGAASGSGSRSGRRPGYGNHRDSSLSGAAAGTRSASPEQGSIQ
jgi:hypothetical protein